MTLTATPDASRALVRVDVAGLPSPVVVTRDDGSGAVPVRDAQPMPSGVSAVDDRECPFGVAVLYRATDGTGAVSEATARLDYPRPRIESAGNAALGVDVAIVADTPPSWEAASAVHRIVGRRDPVVTAQPLRLRAGTLTLAVPTVDAADAVLRVVADGMPVLLRTPCGSLIRDGWISVTSAAEDAPSPRHPARRVALDYVQTGRPSGGSAGRLPWTYADLLTEHGTYAEVTAAHPDYASLAAGPPP